MAREPKESSIDELARGLASGTLSRGKALRLIGAALVGGTLASVRPVLTLLAVSASRSAVRRTVSAVAATAPAAPALLRVYRMAVPAAPPVTVVADRSASMAPV